MIERLLAFLASLELSEDEVAFMKAILFTAALATGWYLAEWTNP